MTLNEKREIDSRQKWCHLVLRTSLVSRYIVAYRLVLRAIRGWNGAGRVQVEGGEQARRKDTARMYGQWV